MIQILVEHTRSKGRDAIIYNGLDIYMACSTCHGSGKAVDNLFRENPRGVKVECERCEGTGQVKATW